MITLAQTLFKRRKDSRAGFIAFIVAGDPSPNKTLAMAKALEKAGTDILEIGVPFSDPVADGPVIEAACQRALKKKMSLEKAAGLLGHLRQSGIKIPIVLFTYLNPIMQLGVKNFTALCKKNGVNAVLVVDLPCELSKSLSTALNKFQIELVLLASPTTSDARLREIGRASSSVVYYVCREGVTGVRQGLAPGLVARLKKVRALTGKPLMAGFGVSKPNQVRVLSEHAEGVVVGSALVNAAARSSHPERAVFNLACQLTMALEKKC